MSFMVTGKSIKGRPLITDLNAVRMAARLMGMEVHDRATYRAHHDCNDAVMVLSCSAEQARLIKEKHGLDPYEVGIVPDPENAGSYLIKYDEWRNGFGLHDVIGQPVFSQSKDGRDEKTIAPLLQMHYRMASDAIAAQQLGDEIEFIRQPDGSYVSHTKPNEARLSV